jgi:hypothetical protein
MRVALRTDLAADESDYFPLSEMSRGMQRAYERTIGRFSATESTGSIAGRRIVPKLCARITINGREFDSSAEMPAEYRRFYEETLARTLPLQRAIRIVAETERANFIKRTVTLAFIAAGCASTIVYLALHGYYA